MWMAQAAVWWSWFTEPSVNMLTWSSLSSAVNSTNFSLAWVGLSKACFLVMGKKLKLTLALFQGGQELWLATSAGSATKMSLCRDLRMGAREMIAVLFPVYLEGQGIAN